MKVRILTTFLVALGAACSLPAEQPFGIAIHGGSGVLSREKMTPELEVQYREALQQSVAAGQAVLEAGGTAVDAIEAAIVPLEDSPLFNAGRGSAFTEQGTIEMDTSIMDGATMKGGGACTVRFVKNPVKLARAVMEDTPHVLLSESGALSFAIEKGLELEPAEYFFTERRWKTLQERKAKEVPYGQPVPSGQSSYDPDLPAYYGTVGAVALDQEGNLAAATSTGGRTNKMMGRVGDSPLIGAATYAKNGTAAVSTTGLGEVHIALGSAITVSHLMEFNDYGVQDALDLVIRERLVEGGGGGGAVAIDAEGNVAASWTGRGMYRGFTTAEGEIVVKIYGDE